MKNVTVVITNHKTPSLAQRCLESLLCHYPAIKVILIDNGSWDRSSRYIAEMAGGHKHIEAIVNDSNLTHGPAMDMGIKAVKTRYAFMLDTDCVVMRGGFLERMFALFEANGNLYAVGWLMYVTERGVEAKPWDIEQIPYVHPSAMTLDRKKYLEIKPMIYHGAPCIENMASARDKGYRVCGFPVDGYVLHFGRGTREEIKAAWHGERK